MKNKHHIPVTTIKLGGKERKLTFDFNAICTVQTLTGINLFQTAVTDFDPMQLRALLFAALLRDEPTITLDEVGSFITPRKVGKLYAAIGEVWEAANEDEESEADESGEDEAQTV